MKLCKSCQKSLQVEKNKTIFKNCGDCRQAKMIKKAYKKDMKKENAKVDCLDLNTY